MKWNGELPRAKRGLSFLIYESRGINIFLYEIIIESEETTMKKICVLLTVVLLAAMITGCRKESAPVQHKGLGDPNETIYTEEIEVEEIMVEEIIVEEITTEEIEIVS